MLNARFFALPVIALTVIVALAQANGRSEFDQVEPRTVYRAVNCANADAACRVAGHGMDNGVVR